MDRSSPPWFSSFRRSWRWTIAGGGRLVIDTLQKLIMEDHQTRLQTPNRRESISSGMETA